jgi:serine/threonine protein kinase
VFGDVYEIQNRQTGDRFALKLAKPHKVDTALRELDLFSEAARTCPTIIQYFGAGMIPFPPEASQVSQLGIVMEFINGKTLREVLREPGLPITEFRHYFIQFLTQLACLSEHGIYHRDLHALNMLVDRSLQRLWIMDFGLACSDNWSARLYTLDAVCESERYSQTPSPQLGTNDLTKGTDEFLGNTSLLLPRLQAEDPQLASVIDQILINKIETAADALQKLK